MHIVIYHSPTLLDDTKKAWKFPLLELRVSTPTPSNKSSMPCKTRPFRNSFLRVCPLGTIVEILEFKNCFESLLFYVNVLLLLHNLFDLMDAKIVKR